MAFELVAASLNLQRRHWSPGEAIRSGSDVGDRAVGLRGLVAETHHAYARSIRVLGSCRAPDGRALGAMASSFIGLVQPFDPSPAVPAIRVTLEVEEADVTAQASPDGAGNETDTQAARGVLNLDLDLTEDESTIEVAIDQIPAETCVFYGATFIETALAAGNLPA